MKSSHIDNDLTQEAEAFDSQIEERIANGHIPDIRLAEPCDYFYNNSWRRPAYVKLDFGEQFEVICDSISKLIGKKTTQIRILEVGSGPGYLSLELARNGFNVVGLDISAKCVEIASQFAEQDPWKEQRGTLDYIAADFYTSPRLQNESFDVVVFLGALHHFPNQAATLKRAKELIKPNGLIIAHEPVRDRVTLGNATFMHLLRTLLSINNNFYTYQELSIDRISDLPDDHYAKEYIMNRCIPEEYWKDIYYTEAYKDFLDRDFPDHGKTDLPNDDRIVLLYTNEGGGITNIAGRALSDTKMRYITVKISDEKKIFGLHRMSRKSTVYVFEGQFDSLFIENGIASGDSNLCGVGTALVDCDVVLVYDNEPRNKEIVSQINKAVENNFKVCLFPDTIPYKDVNDMVASGMSRETVKNIIDSNTVQGLTAKMKFSLWRKC